jgi:O-antigen/teichoic acid export membrane protein
MTEAMPITATQPDAGTRSVTGTPSRPLRADGPSEGTFTDTISGSDDVRLAAKNGAQLGSSLMFTWVIGLLFTNVLLPRLAKPKELGILGFGEAVASIVLVLAGFGLDVYIRQEVAKRSDSAREFIVGTFVLRVITTLLLTAAAISVTTAIGRPAQSVEVVAWFALATFMMQTAEIYGALLQAVGQVSGQARISVATKVLWVVTASAGLIAGVGVRSVPIALAMSEGLKAALLGQRAHQILNIPISATNQRVRSTLSASLPFLATAIGVRVAMWLDVTIMGIVLTDDEGIKATGWYFSALRLSQLALILAPVVTWVVTPLASRAYERSASEYRHLIRRSMQAGLTIAIPLSAVLALNADVVINIMQGPDYAPASRPLRVLSCMFIITYVNMLAGTFLQVSQRGWVVVRATVTTISVDLLLLVILIPYGHANWGAGGAGLAASISLITAELCGASMMMWHLRGGVLDRTSKSAIMSALLCVACLVVVDRMAARAGLFILRPFLDVAVLIGFLSLVRTYDLPKGWQQQFRAMIAGRRTKSSE